MADDQENDDTKRAVEFIRQQYSRDRGQKGAQKQGGGGNAGRGNVEQRNFNGAVQGESSRGNVNHGNFNGAVRGNAARGHVNQGNANGAVQGNAALGNADHGNINGAVQGNAAQGNADHGNVDRGNLGQENLVPDVGPDGGRGGGRVADAVRAPWVRRISPRTLMLVTAGGLFLFALFYRTADAPHSPRAQSRPEVTWTIGASRVAAVAAPLLSAVTYGRYLHALLTASMNVLTSPIDALRTNLSHVTANMSSGTEALKARMLADSDTSWLHLYEIDEYVYMDVENAWFFQSGDWNLRLKLLPRRGVYYFMLWAGIPSPEPPERTARRRAGELIAYLDAGISASEARVAEYRLLRNSFLEKMNSELAYHAPKMRRDGRPRDATQKERDAEAAISVISELVSRAKTESVKQDQLFYKDDDIFDMVKRELKFLSASLSPTNSKFEGPWGRVFNSGARGLEVLVRLEELTGALRWVLAELEEPEP